MKSTDTMSENHLHIIAFDVPYPANYGGVIDVFYRVKALTEAGVKVHLHCFEYGRGEQEILKRCHEVKYYKRDTSFARQLSLTPYIVNSRRSRLCRPKVTKRLWGCLPTSTC